MVIVSVVVVATTEMQAGVKPQQWNIYLLRVHLTLATFTVVAISTCVQLQKKRKNKAKKTNTTTTNEHECCCCCRYCCCCCCWHVQRQLMKLKM